MIAANCVVAASMYWFSSKVFDKGFLSYVTQVELAKLSPFTDELALLYEQKKSWQWIKNDHELWRQLIDYHIKKLPLNRRPPPRPEFGGMFPPNQRFPEFRKRPPPRFDGMPPPPRRDRVNRAPYTPQVKRIDNVVPSFDDHILLRNEFEQAVIGRIHPEHKVNWVPIIVKGERVGDVGVFYRKNQNSNIEQYFINQQKDVFAYMVIVMMLVAITLAFLLSRKLMSHISLLQLGLSALVKGDYEQALNVTSDDELGQLANDFNFLSKTLKENQQSRQQWIADISHELRTPVAILKGELEALIDGVRQIDHMALVSLQQETNRLTLLINDLHELSLSDLGALHYQKESVDLVELVTDFLEDQSTRADMQGLKVSFNNDDTRFWVNIDADRIEQCFNNLLQNTLRYTNLPGQLKVSLKRDKQLLVLTWEDSSPGVDDDDLTYLFDRLYRVEKSRNRAKGGAGIGLSICKNIMDAHDASITVFQSTLGGLGFKIIFSEVRP